MIYISTIIYRVRERAGQNWKKGRTYKLLEHALVEWSFDFTAAVVFLRDRVVSKDPTASFMVVPKIKQRYGIIAISDTVNTVIVVFRDYSTF